MIYSHYQLFSSAGMMIGVHLSVFKIMVSTR